jgi:hypothetical protein
VGSDLITQLFHTCHLMDVRLGRPRAMAVTAPGQCLRLATRLSVKMKVRKYVFDQQ